MGGEKRRIYIYYIYVERGNETLNTSRWLPAKPATCLPLYVYITRDVTSTVETNWGLKNLIIN